MKKTFLKAGVAALALTLFISAPASAQSQTRADGDTVARSNFYLGGYGGYGWTDADIDAGPTADVNGGDYGVMAGFEIGGFLDRSLGVGLNGALEFHYGWSDADDTVGGALIEKDNEWGVSFRPGLAFVSKMMPLDLKPYAILGYRRTELEVTTGGTTFDQGYDGFELGIGTELVAYGDFGVRLDYTHVFYGEEAGIDPSEDNLRLGVVYHF